MPTEKKFKVVATATQDHKGSRLGSKRGLKKGLLKKSTKEDESPVEEFKPAEIRLSRIGAAKKSPIELDLEIQSQRVMYVLDCTIEKLYIVAYLKEFIKQDGLILRHYHMGPQELDFILDACGKHTDINPERCHKGAPNPYATVIDKISLVNFGKEAKDKQHDKKEEKKKVHGAIGEISKKDEKHLHKLAKCRTSTVSLFGAQKNDAYMTQVMELLANNKCVKRYVAAKAGLPRKTTEEEPDAFDTLITAVKNLKDIASKMLTVTASQEREREKELRTAYMENLEIQQNIEKLSEQLQNQRDELGEQFLMKETVMYTCQSKIDELHKSFKANVKNRIMESEKAMVQDTTNSVIRQAELEEEAELITESYKKLLTEHLTAEKALRVKRFKIETQLSSWLAKYDADIGERQAEFEEITQNYEEEKAELEALQEKFDEQEEEYDELMAEKEEVERAIYEEKAYEFLKNRSARRIQRYWRAYRERKLARKKARKGKGKGKGGKKGKKEPKKEPSQPIVTRTEDPNAALEKQFAGEVIGDLTRDEEFKQEVSVDL